MRRMDIPGFDGVYAVTDTGLIWSYPRKWMGKRKHGGRYLTVSPNSLGYATTFLNHAKTGVRRNGVRIHQLVAQAFVPNPNSYHEVNHKDGNKLNNHYKNLEWCTRSHNLRHAYESGLRISNKGKKYNKYEVL